MLPLFQEMYADMKTAHEQIYLYLKSIRESMLTSYSLETQADLCYALRESQELIDDMRKQCNQMFEALEKDVGVKVTKRSLASGVVERIDTEYCTCETNTKEMFVVPRSNATDADERDKYEKLMTYLGIDPNLWDYGKVMFHEGELETKVVDIHWPGLQSYFQRLKAAGFPLPTFIDINRTWIKFALKIRKRKGVMGDAVIRKTAKATDASE